MSERNTYPVNDLFLTLQGEGANAGRRSVFLRFAGCNQTCRVETHGFDCDTEFASSVRRTASEIATIVGMLWERGSAQTCGRPFVVITGGEPLLHCDDELAAALGDCDVAIETNGSLPLPAAWIEPGSCFVACSPKVAEHVIRLQRCDELRYVRGLYQGLPQPKLRAEHRYLSPRFTPEGVLDPEALARCQELIATDPSWRLSVQSHKLIGIE